MPHTYLVCSKIQEIKRNFKKEKKNYSLKKLHEIAPLPISILITSAAGW